MQQPAVAVAEEGPGIERLVVVVVVAAGQEPVAVAVVAVELPPAVDVAAGQEPVAVVVAVELPPVVDIVAELAPDIVVRRLVLVVAAVADPGQVGLPVVVVVVEPLEVEY